MISRLIFALTLLAGTVVHADPIAVIFDCDGVLVETEPLKFKAWQKALEPLKITITEAEYLPLVGYDNPTIIKRLSEMKHRRIGPAIIAKKEKIYDELQKQGVIPRTAGVALAKYLAAHRKELNVKLGLASGGRKKEILENLRQTGLDKVFDVIVSGTDDLAEFKDPAGTNKPKPYVYQKAAKLLGIAPKDAAVFEDSASGVEAAARAGMTVYAIPNDFTKGQDFKLAHEVLRLPEAPEPTLARLFKKLPADAKQ